MLGVTIDDQLNFNIRINEICKRASQRVGVMMRLKKLIPTNAKLTLYKSAILPYLTYCHLTWHLCTASNKRKLERMQERELRALFLDKQSSYQAPLDKGDLITLQNRRLKILLSSCIMSHENIRAISYALYTLQLERSRVRHPQI